LRNKENSILFRKDSNNEVNMRITPFLLTVSFLTGCATADVVQTNYQGEKPTVTLKYLNAGASGIIESRRQAAILKAKEYCGGRVKLLGENSKAEFAGFTKVTSNYAMAMNSDYQYMLFECIDKEKKEVIY
jgi:hypothetical protein